MRPDNDKDMDIWQLTEREMAAAAGVMWGWPLRRRGPVSKLLLVNAT